MQWPFKSTIRFAGQDGNVVRIQYGSWATRYLAMSLRKSWLQRGKRQRSLSSQTVASSYWAITSAAKSMTSSCRGLMLQLRKRGYPPVEDLKGCKKR